MSALRPECVVAGCGVSGLTCGIRLRERGYAVTIIARDLPPHTTSDIAAAVWYPYKAHPVERVLAWSATTFDEFCRLAEEAPECGVSLATFVELHDRAVPDPWWRPAVRRFARPQPEDLPLGYVDGYVIEVPLIETPVYMRYLLGRFEGLGGHIEQRTIGSLAELYRDGRLVVNCSGLGAREVVGDAEMFAIRGQIVRVRVPAPGLRRGLFDEEGPRAVLYIIPRRDDCILGGTADEHDERLAPDPATAANILRKCRELEPALRDAEVLGHAVGLRPGRKAVRLELERVSEGCVVIHNYGHGGAGFTLSWGCADEVVGLAEG